MSGCDNGVKGGGYETTAEEDMAAFDELPMPLRRALAEAPLNLAAQPVAAAWWAPRGILADLDCLERLEWLLEDLSRTVRTTRNPE